MTALITPEQQAVLRRRGRWRGLLLLLAMGAVVPAVMAKSGPALLLFAGLVTAAAAVWRCPVCQDNLGRERKPAFCRRCGARLLP